ncbi:TetR family transcriptional regulator [Streptomyces sp. Ag109_O5-1]|nr:TetR family transcriptional regulator [Streptomyces sp. Ag109_O5-1]
MDYGTGREALLNAAVRVVAQGGLRKLTYRAVAQEAGVTHGLVVHHFGSRDALTEAALTHAVRTSASTSELEPGTGNAADFAAGLSDMVIREPDMQLFQYELMLESRRRPELLPKIRALYSEYFEATERELSRILPEGADPALTRLVFAALEGLVLHQLVLGEPEVTEAAPARTRPPSTTTVPTPSRWDESSQHDMLGDVGVPDEARGCTRSGRSPTSPSPPRPSRPSRIWSRALTAVERAAAVTNAEVGALDGDVACTGLVAALKPSIGYWTACAGAMEAHHTGRPALDRWSP